MEELERLEGWKALTLWGHNLYSGSGGTMWWPPGSDVKALCGRSFPNPHTGLSAPQAGCSCGIYAAETVGGAMSYMGVGDGTTRVLCKVRGKVRAFVGDEGAWRAERAEIEAVVAMFPEDAFRLAPVAERYGVPLLFWPEGAEYLARACGEPTSPARSLKYFDERAHRRARQPYKCKDCGTDIAVGSLYYCVSMNVSRRRYCEACGQKLRRLYVMSLEEWDKAGRPRTWNMSLARYRKRIEREEV